jgi:hypothetical protein
MRSSTLLWLFLAAICGGVLFYTTQRVTDGRARLAILDEDIRKETETIRVLKAEWSYLNQPERLEKLAREYLDLAPLKGRQFAKVSELGERAEAAVASSLPPVEEKPAAEPVTKPAPVAAAAAAPKKSAPPVVKIRQPAPPPRVAAPRAPVTADDASQRSFGDVMKSLGVDRP